MKCINNPIEKARKKKSPHLIKPKPISLPRIPMTLNPSPIMESNAMIWFRKGLRIHDNPALDQARRGCTHLYPVFVLDPHYLHPDPSAFSPGSARCGVNRIHFLLESLRDLDAGLRRLGSRLLLLRGEPAPVVCRLLKGWKIGKLCFEDDTEPYALARDKQVKDFASKCGIEVHSPVSHTLFNPSDIIEKNGGRPPLTYQSFIALAGKPVDPLTTTYSILPPVGETGDHELLSVPKIEDLGYGDISEEEFSPFRGGETEALKRLDIMLEDKAWVTQFEKPKGDPSAFRKPATTVLSPYLKFGCISSRYFYKRLQDIYTTVGKHTKPPVSLVGQLLWRDFFYTVAFGTPNFDRMKGNKICKQIPWRENEQLLVAWRDGRTGYPWIDAIMIQFVHWEKGRDVFERLLIDSDWAINNGNWLWLSCSSFFYQYFRIYSPISFGKKYDPDGKYIRHFLPVLKDFPKEYIYEPWTAPLAVQKKANCIIGKDYPKAVVDHGVASKECKKLMGEALASPTSNADRLNQKAPSSSRKKHPDYSHEITSLKQRKKMK